MEIFSCFTSEVVNLFFIVEQRPVEYESLCKLGQDVFQGLLSLCDWIKPDEYEEFMQPLIKQASEGINVVVL